MIRHDQIEIDKKFDDDFVDIANLFEKNDEFKKMFLEINKRVGKKAETWDKIKQSNLNLEESQAAILLEQQVKTLQQFDFIKANQGFDYFPTLAIAKPGKITKVNKAGKTIKQTRGRTEDFANPVQALKQMAQDISAARVLASRFDIDLNNIKVPAKLNNTSRVDVVINAIQKAAKDQGATSEVSKNLAKGLRSQILASQKGGATIGSLSRRSISAALLANPLNALLNVSEAITAPIVQNGITAYARTIPSTVIPVFKTLLEELSSAPLLGKVIPDYKANIDGWFNNRILGIEKEFMGELANIGKKSFNDSADFWSKFTNSKINTNVSTGTKEKIDDLSKLLYKATGVSTVNRLGQEVLMNTAIKRGVTLAKSGTSKDLEKLRKHDGMRGLSESEFQSTVLALKKGDFDNKWLINFAGASLNKWQPISASALPRAFHDNPNGRIMYSMLSYMNRQFNNIREDIVLKGAEALKYGLNTKKGSEAAKDSMRNAAVYVGAFGVFAGMWDDWRKTLDQSNDKYLEDILTPEGITSATMNQLSSNVTGGLINMRASEYGGEPFDPTPAPVNAASNLGSAVFSSGKNMLTGEPQPVSPLLRASRTYVPGIANIDRLKRTITGNRLFDDYLN